MRMTQATANKSDAEASHKNDAETPHEHDAHSARINMTRQHSNGTTRRRLHSATRQHARATPRRCPGGARRWLRRTAGALALCWLSGAAAAPYHERAEVLTFIDQAVAEHDFSRAALIDLFRRAVPQERALELARRPYEERPWPTYRDAFVTRLRISHGVEFWRAHAGLLARVEQRFGVPPEIVLAIVGVETRYGRTLGGFPVAYTLITRGFDGERRNQFFRRELLELLLLEREAGLSVGEVKGSYAGAMGIGQFIPSSYRAYAVDFDDDGARNLWSEPDALASVANYLVRHGWVSGGPLASRVTTPFDADRLAQDGGGTRPRFNSADLARHGLPDAKTLGVAAEPFAVVSLADGNGAHERWLTYKNFYVVTRYNRSARYAMAVTLLAQRLRHAYQHGL